MNLSRLTSAQRLMLGSMGVTVIAAFLPWASVLGISKSGIDGDGVITLILALIGAAALVFATARGWSTWVVLVTGALVALVGILDMNGIAAIGLYLTMFAGLTWCVGWFWQRSLSKAPVPGVTPPALDAE